MRAYAIIIALLCTFIFGALGAQAGFTYATIIPFLLGLSMVAYFSLSSQERGGPITFDRITHV